MENARRVANTDINVFPLVIGGHSFSRLPDKTMPTDDEAIAIIEALVAGGVSHFDCTWEAERQAYSRLLERAGLKDNLQPIIWHGWHDYEEKAPDDIVNAFRGVLGELGYSKASMVILNQWEHGDERKHFYLDHEKSKGFADWFWDGFGRIKELGLVDAVGWAVEPGPLNAEFLNDNCKRIDFIAPYWNYRNRQNQHLVELAKKHQLGVYAVAPFCRGKRSIFNLGGVDHRKMIRPWLKWVLREPSVFAMPISLPSLEEAEETLAAYDDNPFGPEDAEFMKRLPLEIFRPMNE